MFMPSWEEESRLDSPCWAWLGPGPRGLATCEATAQRSQAPERLHLGSAPPLNQRKREGTTKEKDRKGLIF